MDKTIYFEIEKALKFLPLDKLKEVEDFIKFLLSKSTDKVNIKQLFGSIKKEDIELMKEAIADACEKTNYEQW